jgi:hypothetical protein
MNLSTAASGPQRFSTPDFKFEVEVASVTESVHSPHYSLAYELQVTADLDSIDSKSILELLQTPS